MKVLENPILLKIFEIEAEDNLASKKRICLINDIYPTRNKIKVIQRKQ